MLRPTSNQDSGYGELLESPPSLWSLVEDQVPWSERAEVKRILGEAAVDLSLDLHLEVEVLLELWRDLRSTSPPGIQSPHSSSCPILADPPVIKDMVTQEIRMLLLSVKMKARHHGLDEDQALSKYNPRVVSFVMGTGRAESRSRSIGSGLSRPPSGCRAVHERPFSSLSTGSSIEDDLQELKDKLQISHIDDVILHLRSLLEDECQTLERDIIILQHHLEEERQYVEELQAEPSLTELREERRVLERDLHLDQFPATSALTTKMASNRKPNPARILDLGRKEGIAVCRSSPKVSYLQHDPPITPSPPDPKLKTPEGRSLRRVLPGPGAPSCAAEEPGLSATRRSVPGVSAPLCHRGRGAAPRHTSDEETHRAAGAPVNNLLPLPPKVQRAPSTSGPAPAFRRVRTRVTNVPP